MQAEFMLTMTNFVEVGDSQDDECEIGAEMRTQKTQEITVSPLMIGEKRLNSTGKEPNRQKVSYELSKKHVGEFLMHE
jgi:hypothetical protein